jgi:hypothetical protein
MSVVCCTMQLTIIQNNYNLETNSHKKTLIKPQGNWTCSEYYGYILIELNAKDEITEVSH